MVSHNQNECCCVDCCSLRENSLTIEQASYYNNLLSVEMLFLKSFGWVEVMPIALGAPFSWKDPMGEDERSQDIAVATQKSRLYSLSKYT